MVTRRWGWRGSIGALVLALVLVFVPVCPPASANAITEIGPRHWAMDALKTLTRAGLVSVEHFPADSGGLTRLEVALSVLEALNRLRGVDAEEAEPWPDSLDLTTLIQSYNHEPSTRQIVGPKETDALRRLVGEFSAELAILGVDTSAAVRRAGNSEDSVTWQFVDIDAIGVDSVGQTVGESPELIAVPGMGLAAAPEIEDVVSSAGEAAVAQLPTETTGTGREPVQDLAQRSLPEAGPGLAETPTEGEPAEAQGANSVKSRNHAMLPVEDRLQPSLAFASDAPLPALPEVLESPPKQPTPVPTQMDEVRMAIPPVGARLDPGPQLSAVPDSIWSSPSKGFSVGEQLTMQDTLATTHVLALDAQIGGAPTHILGPRRGLVVEPSVRVSSEVAQGGNLQTQASSVKVEASVQVGTLVVGANVKNAEGINAIVTAPDPLKDSEGYGLSVKYKDVTFSTDFEKVTRAAERQNLRTIGLNYSFTDLATLRAGYQFADVDSVDSVKSKANATLGVDVSVSEFARVSAGFTLEGPAEEGISLRNSDGQKASAGVELKLPWNAQLTAGYELYRRSGEDDATTVQQTATLGLGYNFSNNATLLFGYRLIDFGDDSDEMGRPKEPQQDLMAGVSLRF